MKTLNFNQKWILVTGASSGLGYEMARQLAYQHKANLIITARRADKLNQLKSELENKAGVQVKTIVADMSVPADVDRLITECLDGQQLYAAILNAGVTFFGSHLELTETDFERMLQTNVRSVVRIATEVTRYFETNKQEGGLMVVSSMGALFPVPYQAIYSGTKGFVMNFINALALELKNPNFSLTVYAPGGIATEMTEGEKFNDLKGWLMPVEQAAKEGIYALHHRKYNHIPGVLNRIGSSFMRVMPKRFIVGQLGRTYAKALAKLNTGK